MMPPLILLLMLADPSTYLAPVCRELVRTWPDNRTVNIVCHGHSVPAGYFATPKVDTFNAYPHLFHVGLKRRFPNAVVNVVVTAVGGENSEAGAARFVRDVMSFRPDVVVIDYALNDRGIGLAKARKAWVSMVREAKAGGAKVLLLTPTPDLNASILDPVDPLVQHSAQIREIALAEEVGLVDVFGTFQKLLRGGQSLQDYMSQSNHPNRAGHEIVAAELLRWFPEKS